MVNHKRKIGAQPGNQNARKHGFYSKANDGLPKQLKKARQLEGIDLEIALARVKIREILLKSPASNSTFLKAVSTLARLVTLKHELPVKTNEPVRG